MANASSPFFAGVQKLTLLDYPDKTACTLFTVGCNFACPFCQNPSLIAFAGGADSILPHEYIFDFLESRKGLLDGVCLSGGEPLANEGLFEFTRKVKEMGFLVKLDTNGSYPDRLKALAESGNIDYVAMDIKNTPEKYPETIGVSGYNAAVILKSIEYLLSGKVPYEFRTTVVRDFHTADDLLSIARLILGTEKYYLQNFENPERALRAGLCAYSDKEIREICELVREVLPCTRLRSV